MATDWTRIHRASPVATELDTLQGPGGPPGRHSALADLARAAAGTATEAET